MLALSRPYHHSNRSQNWSLTQEKDMRPHNNIPRPQSSSVAGPSSRPGSASGLRRSHTSRRSSAFDSSSPPSATRPNNNPASPPVPSSTQASQSTSSAPPQTSTPPASPPQLDIANYPSSDLLKLLAALLQQIASANDALRSPASAPVPTSARSTPSSTHESADLARDTTIPRPVVGVLPSPSSFHARNIPTISIESYLLRILKYCPTTNEVFLSLLVYFDRMSRSSAEPGSITPGFAIDSYNVHRLVIAGVTVASKFFSDVFYLNSRYAKVGGLPQSELNQLELQFLLLNDFRLLISPEEMQRYANQLLVYSTTLHPPSPSLPLPPPVVTPDVRPSAPESTLPTPYPSPSSSGNPGVNPVTPQHAFRQESSYDQGSEEGGYGTTDDETTIRPDHSSEGSSIHTSSSVATSRATTPATSPTRRTARWSTGSRRTSVVAGVETMHEPTQVGDADDDDADTDGEGDETDDEDVYRGRRRSPSARSTRLLRLPHVQAHEDTRMSSP